MEGHPMTTQRDPRVTPAKGDVLRTLDRIGLPFDRIVMGVEDDRVDWRVGSFGYSATMTEWQQMNATAEVVKVAEEGT